MYKSGKGCCAVVAMALLQLPALPAVAELALGPQEIVQADAVDIDVTGYSVPSFVYWDSDDLMDLVSGEGPVSSLGKVRVYLNTGIASEPSFSTYFYAQSNGFDLEIPGGG